jgi:hypothetical protein
LFVVCLIDAAIHSVALGLTRFGSGAAFLNFAACGHPHPQNRLPLTAHYPSQISYEIPQVPKVGWERQWLASGEDAALKT